MEEAKAEKRFYHWLIGAESEGWNRETGKGIGKRFNGNLNRTNISVDNPDKIHKAAEILGIKHYQIEASPREDDAWGGETIFRTPEIMAYDAKVEKEKTINNKAKTLFVEKINLSFKGAYDYKALPNGTTIWLDVSPAEYHPHLSGRVRYGVHFIIRKNSVDQMFDLGSYFSNHGMVAAQSKFRKDLIWLFGVDHGIEDKEAKSMLLDMKAFKEKKQAEISRAEYAIRKQVEEEMG